LQPSVPNIQPRARCLITERSIRSRVWASFMPNMMFQSVRRMPSGVLVTISASQSPTNWPYNLSASGCSGAGSSHAASGSGRKMSSSTFVPPQVTPEHQERDQNRAQATGLQDQHWRTPRLETSGNSRRQRFVVWEKLLSQYRTTGRRRDRGRRHSAPTPTLRARISKSRVHVAPWSQETSPSQVKERSVISVKRQRRVMPATSSPI
jgi:hypothetical protein